MSEPLRLQDVERVFVQGAERLHVLRGVNLALRAGEVAALVGPSGAGKSTLLHIAGLLERASGGEVLIDDAPASRMSETERTLARRAKLGFVYQFHHLLPEFSALENVAMPLIIAGLPKSEAKQRASALLGRLGLAERLKHRPARLSGGEQQRVAIARAVVHGPKVLLADEPTGNLDHATADVVFGELLGLVREHQLAALIATHNPDLAARMDRVVHLKDGVLV
ncbi:ABC transporter ATP-binding protein [Desertibaculum subflavum]|uniref:ABC transporter ATP-binding protein n=1 Tax=Desertibaculum subflavum TaxID=2268458 RepID=UPI000E66D065